MSRAHANATDRAHVTGQRELELTRGQVPDFDDTVSGACGKPLVARVNVNAPHPASMAADDAVKLPRCMPLRFGHGHQRLLLNQGVLLIREQSERLGVDR